MCQTLNFQTSSLPIFADLKILILPDLVKILNAITISNFISNSVPQSLITLYDHNILIYLNILFNFL